MSETTSGKEFNYMMLGRLQTDCEYFLGGGNGSEKHLWAQNVGDQISEMERIYKSLKEKPEWISEDDICIYKKKMFDKLKEGAAITITKTDIRNHLKDLGFAASIKKHGLIENAIVIHVPDLGIGQGNVFPGNVVKENKKVFDYVNSLAGAHLASGEKVIGNKNKNLEEKNDSHAFIFLDENKASFRLGDATGQESYDGTVNAAQGVVDYYVRHTISLGAESHELRNDTSLDVTLPVERLKNGLSQ